MVETTRWNPAGMRDLAGGLVQTSQLLRSRGSEARSALASVGSWLPVDRSLTDTATWAETAAVDLIDRADGLELADRTIHIELGFGLSFTIDLDAFLHDTPERIAELERQLRGIRASASVPVIVIEELVAELTELRTQRLTELSLLSIVDPSADWSAEIAAVVADLGFTPATVAEVIAASERGLGPGELGLPAILFPPGYVASHTATIDPILEAIVRLEAAVAERTALVDGVQAAFDRGDSFDEIYEAFGEVPIGFDVALFEIQFELQDAQQRLANARNDLARDRLDTIEWIVSLPFPAHLVAPVAGRMLADELLDDSGDLAPIAAILDSAALPALDQAFYQRLGASAAAMLPTRVAQEADYDDRDATQALLRSYSESLARAAEAGLSYSGGDVVWPEDPDWLIQPAELLRTAEFPQAFLVDAGATLIEVYGGFETPLFSIGPILFAPPPDYNDDPRHIVLSHLTSPRDAEALLDRLISDGLVDDLVDPATPYLDDGWDVAGVMAAARHSDDALAALVESIGNTGGVQPGVALGAVALLDGNMELVIPTGRTWDPETTSYSGIDRFDYAADPRIGSLIDEAAIDRLMEAIMEHDLATAALVADFGAFVRAEMRGTSPDVLQDRLDELGAAAGRIIRIRNDVFIADGADADARNAFAGTVVSVIGGVTVAVATGGWGAVAAIAAGAAGDVAVDLGFDAVFPADSEVEALRSALGDDTFDLELWRYLVVEAIWNQDPGFFGDTPPPIELDGTLSSLVGPTIGDDACYPEDPHALEAWYSWLHSLPNELQLAVDAMADTANSRVAEESRLRLED